jgi:hypothetical protein
MILIDRSSNYLKSFEPSRQRCQDLSPLLVLNQESKLIWRGFGESDNRGLLHGSGPEIGDIDIPPISKPVAIKID